MGTIDRLPPSFEIAAVAGSTGLLSNEEADIVVCMIGSFKAPKTEDTALIEGTVPSYKRQV